MWRSMAVGLVLIGLSGCGRGNVSLSEVTGTVRMNGKPVTDASVVFRPLDKGRPSLGVTDGEGKYRLKYAEGKWGALAGKHKISVSTLVEPDSDSSDPVKQAGKPERIPTDYNTYTSLEAEVRPGEKEVLDIEMEGEEIVAQVDPTGVVGGN